tara:strand:- start:113 stop:751 length:639 start_codon:yes stop_codon:yes gene_type:complete
MPQTSAPRILIADDHALIREALPLIIRPSVPLATFDFASNSAELMSLSDRETWDLIILDIGIPGDREFNALKTLRARFADLPILILSMFPEQKMGALAIEAGATGYVCKTVESAVIAKAVVTLLDGQKWISPRIQRNLAKQGGSARGNYNDLSTQEGKVLRLLAHGHSNKQIAVLLKISVSSVGTYRQRILDKLGLDSTSKLVRYVIEHRLM